MEFTKTSTKGFVEIPVTQFQKLIEDSVHLEMLIDIVLDTEKEDCPYWKKYDLPIEFAKRLKAEKEEF